PLLSCIARSTGAPDWLWRGAFPVPAELACDPRALFSFGLSEEVVLALPRPVVSGLEGVAGAPGDVIARSWPYAVRRGALLVAVTAQLSALPASSPASALAEESCS